MRIVIVNCFETYEERVDLLMEYFTLKGHEVSVIQSNFEHMKKKVRSKDKKNYIFVKTPKYKKNFSISRMYSHYIFSKSATRLIKKTQPELIYALIPPNYLSKFLGNYKKKTQNCKLVFDLIDLWPETFPIQKIKKLFPFRYWTSLRKKGIQHADLVISECDFYREVVEKELEGINCNTVYLAKPYSEIEPKENLDNSSVSFCYLGSINNIIDISRIKKLLEEVNKLKKVKLHIIGDGEKRNELINEIKSLNIDVVYHGKIYDEIGKQSIFDTCHFGINIMKKEVCVGLTMKSIDYFRAGLPIVNTIKSDTENLIDQYNSGINIDTKSKDINQNDINKIIKYSNQQNSLMRKNTEKMFSEQFTKEKFMENMDFSINDLLLEIKKVV